MKGDIVLKIIVGFLVPLLMLYASFLLFFVQEIGLFTIFHSAVYLIIAYLFFYIRFEKIKLKRILPLQIITFVCLCVFLLFLCYFLYKLLGF